MIGTNSLVVGGLGLLGDKGGLESLLQAKSNIAGALGTGHVGRHLIGLT